MNLVAELLLCFLGSACSSLLVNVPRRAVLACGLMGNIAWFTSLLLIGWGTSVLASNFLAALTVALIAELMARWMQLPVSCFWVPGILPLVPGVTAYRAMYAFVEDQYTLGSQMAVQTLLVAAAISGGIMLAGSLFQLVRAGRGAPRKEAGSYPTEGDPT